MVRMLIVKYCCGRRQSSDHARSLGAPLWPIGAGLGAGNKTTSSFGILLGGRGSHHRQPQAIKHLKFLKLLYLNPCYKLRPYKLRPHKLCLYKLRPYKLRPHKLRLYKLRPYKLRLHKLRLYKLCLDKLRPHKLCLHKLRPTQALRRLP